MAGGTLEDKTIELAHDPDKVPQALDAAVKVIAQKDPAQLPWKDLGVDIVIESTGRFTDAEKARAHMTAGAKRVVISAPAKGEDITICMGINENKFDPAKHFTEHLWPYGLPHRGAGIGGADVGGRGGVAVEPRHGRSNRADELRGCGRIGV